MNFGWQFKLFCMRESHITNATLKEIMGDDYYADTHKQTQAKDINQGIGAIKTFPSDEEVQSVRTQPATRSK